MPDLHADLHRRISSSVVHVHEDVAGVRAFAPMHAAELGVAQEECGGVRDEVGSERADVEHDTGDTDGGKREH